MSFQWIEKFDNQVQRVGYKQSHIILWLRYCKMLQDRIMDIII